MMTPKINSLRAIVAMSILGFSISPAGAYENLPQTEISPNDKISQDWTPIRVENGIAISYTSIFIDGEQYLSIQFENTTATDVDFIWSMTKNATQLRITEDEMAESRVQIPSHSGVIYDGAYLIPMTNTDQYSDFTITLQPTKH